MAAGFIAVSIGTASDGSLVQRAMHLCIAWSMKAILHTLNNPGIQSTSPALDSVGGMAKTVEDLKIMNMLLEGRDYASSLTLYFKGLRIGFVDLELWRAADSLMKPSQESDGPSLAAMEAASLK